MAGANYMGGKRNNAKAHFKDANGKVQKGHFMKQRHQLLTQALRDRGSLDNDSIKAHQAQKRKEITFAHAQRDIHHVPHSIQKSSAIQVLSTTPTCAREERKHLSHSKLLEKLDIEDPSGLRATINRLLDLPDLAGLSGMSFHSSGRKYDDNSLEDGPIPRKRQRTASISSSVLIDSPQCSPDRPPPQSQEYYCNSLDLLEGSGTPGYANTIAEDLFISSPIPSSNRGHWQDTNRLSSDQFSTMLECGTPNDSGFSELSFSDSFDTPAVIQTSAPKVNSELSSGASNASPFSASSSDKKTKFQFVPRDSIVTSSSANSCRASLLSMAVPRRPTFTPNPVLARSAFPTYPSSPPLSNEPHFRPCSTTQLSNTDTDIGNLTSNFVSLLDVPDPWRYLDDVLGLQPQASRADSERRQATTNLVFNDRAGLGHTFTHPAVQNSPSHVPDLDENIIESDVNTGEMVATTMDKTTILDSGELDTGVDNMVLVSPQELRRSSSLLEVSARDILHMKRHILSSASQVRHSREPFVVAGSVTGVFAPTIPRTRSPTQAFPALTNNLPSSSNGRKNCSPSMPGSDEHHCSTNEPELSVSATVRQMLFPHESPISHLNIRTMKTQSSPQFQFSAPSKLSSSPMQAATIPSRVTFGGPDLFGGMEDDEE